MALTSEEALRDIWEETDTEYSEPESSGDEDEEGEEEVSSSQARRSWSATMRPSRNDVFTGAAGPTERVVVRDPDSPIQYFCLMFTNFLLDILVTETNRYAAQNLDGRTMSPHARLHKWVDVDIAEMKKFLGLVILTGIVQKKGHLASYWSTNELISTPYFSKIMPRNRFDLILSNLHYNDNEKRPEENTDPLFKIRPVYDYLNSRWQSLYNLGEALSIDEGMLKWRGRVFFRVYNPLKPTKYGIKSYISADSVNHYCWHIDTYHGEKKTLKQTVCRLLTDQCSEKWHTLYKDNLYNSVELSEILLSKKIHTVGALRKNRGASPGK